MRRYPKRPIVCLRLVAECRDDIAFMDNHIHTLVEISETPLVFDKPLQVFVGKLNVR